MGSMFRSRALYLVIMMLFFTCGLINEFSGVKISKVVSLFIIQNLVLSTTMNSKKKS